MRLLQLRYWWTRLGVALVTSAAFALLIDHWATLEPTPFSLSVLDWLLAPGVYLALVMSGEHGGPLSQAITWIVTSLILTAITYGLLSLLIHLPGGKKQV